MTTTYEIDGRHFSTLEGFFEEVSNVVVPEYDWGHNLDAFNDILRGGFGTPDGGFTVRWKNCELSKERLGYPETVRQLELRVQRCHPTARKLITQDLELARRGEGKTVFDWLVDILKDHGPGGTEEQSHVQLELR